MVRLALSTPEFRHCPEAQINEVHLYYNSKKDNENL